MNRAEIENNIKDKKAEEKSIMLTLTFYKDHPSEGTWGNNSISYELYYNSKEKVVYINEMGAFGDRTLVGRFSGKNKEGITEDDFYIILIKISNMTYSEFKNILDNTK